MRNLQFANDLQAGCLVQLEEFQQAAVDGGESGCHVGDDWKQADDEGDQHHTLESRALPIDDNGCQGDDRHGLKNDRVGEAAQSHGSEL